MARLNGKPEPLKNHAGGVSGRLTKIQQLKRSVLNCLLWEDNFYEDGQSVAARIKELVKDCPRSEVAALAVEARNEMHLRHVPLLLVRELARNSSGIDSLVSETLKEVIQRPDELGEFLSLYWQDGRVSLSHQVKKGLAKAFTKFSAYQLAKYNRDNSVKLRDVMFLCHPKPVNEKQAEVWKKLVEGTLESPDTWEVALSGGADKRETFERLIAEGKLGYMALLRNLRNMHGSGVDGQLVANALLAGAKFSKVLPFRFVAAARAVPSWEPAIDAAMLEAMTEMPRMKGSTVVLVDVSGSMDERLSGKSDLTRLDAACALAALIAGVCDEVAVFSFSECLAEIPPRKGMALIDAINQSQSHLGTRLGLAVKALNENKYYDRLIVVTDEQSHDSVPNPKGMGYMINVATHQCGVAGGAWRRIDGWSESVVRYIQAMEAE